jgi:acetyl esterase/lipase
MKQEFSQVHPELQHVVRKMPKLTYSKKNLWLIHVLTRYAPPSRVPQEILVENVFIPTANNQKKIRLRIYKRKSLTASMPVLLWLHGGGYVMGHPEQDDGSCIQYVRELGIIVISVDYRYAPKYPFPVGLGDCYTALQWVVAHAQDLGVDGKRIAIGGASAGGGLAASLIQFTHDRQEIKPIFQLLVYPMLDDRTVLRSKIDNNDHIVWNQRSNRFGWESYLGTRCGAENVPEYSVPARRKELTGLPETWIGVGTLDLFHDEDLAYAQRLKECDVKCEIYTVPGAFHGFDVFDPQLPIVRDFRESQVLALKKCFSL